MSLVSNTTFFEKTFWACHKNLPGNDLAWLMMKREKALEKISRLPIPNRHQEEWKYTRVQHLYQTDYKNFTDLPATPTLNQNQLKDFLITKKNYLICIDGKLVLSQLSEHNHMNITSFEVALTENPEFIKSVSPQIEAHHSPFTAANQSLAHGGIVAMIPANLNFENPIEILFIVTQPLVAYHLHNLIVVGENTQVKFIERYIDLSNSNHWNNVITQVIAKENSEIEHIKIIDEGIEGNHIATTFCEQFEKSSYTHHHFTLSGKLVRSDLEVFLKSQEALTNLMGLYIGRNSQHIDHHTTLYHNVPHTQSNQLYKGILTDKASAVFNGKIKVAHHAAHTIARQLNHNLLLSRQAEVNTKPQLEIFTDEVQCTHGATIGQLSTEALFYLQSRGVELHEANTMLTQAFAAEMIDKISKSPVKNYIQEEIVKLLKA